MAWRTACRGRSKIVANSGHSRAIFLNTVCPANSVDVVYNGFDSSPLREPIQHNEACHIIYVGRLATGKGLKQWLDAARYLLRFFPDAKFSLAGDGPLRSSIQEYIARHDLQKSIELVGFVGDVNRFIRDSDLLMFLSEHESFGNAPVEAILAGVPVVVSDIPSFREIFNNYPEFIVPSNELMMESIRSRVARLDELRQRAAQLRPVFAERFASERHALQISHVYQQS
jgi:glycosyltransferase involved in cell wall biosynthesis